ncbi:MAG: hypothetical protein PHR25_01360 [Clostridia bacterium]|nr:hypothetical protein [Clostridia bacterium]MDD4375415.1 hypothetical protein [Clostridia bacterium]
MAIIGIFGVILLIAIPIVIVVGIVMAIVKKGKSETDSEDFEKIVRTLYTYLLVIGFLGGIITGVVSAVNTGVDYFLPEEKEIIEPAKYNEYDYKHNEILNEELNNERRKNENVVNMYTSFATVAICTPMFIYHLKLTKKDR